jgi:hypothetical protein
MRTIQKTTLLAVTAVLAMAFGAAPFVEDALQAHIPRKCCDFSSDCPGTDMCCISGETCQNPDDVGQYTCYAQSQGCPDPQ